MDNDGVNLIEKAIRYAHKVTKEKESNQASLFGSENDNTISKPKVGHIEPYGNIEKLNIEKEMVGLYISGHPLDQFNFEMKHFTNTTLGKLKDLNKLGNGELRLAGIITNVKHRITKNKKPFGQMTLEDYNDSHQFFLFSDNYLKFKAFLEEGWFIYVKGQVTKRWKSEEPEFRITHIEYLGDIWEKLTKGIQLNLKTDNIDTLLIDSLETIIQKHPGKGIFKINLKGQHDAEDFDLEMVSRKINVDPTPALIKELNSIQILNYNILT